MTNDPCDWNCREPNGVDHRVVWARQKLLAARSKRDKSYYRDIVARGLMDVLLRHPDVRRDNGQP